MIIINGEKLNVSSLSLLDYLSQKAYRTDRIAVELNGEILPKSLYGDTVLKDGDKAEIVSFVGGG